jgi:hypothetical protein
MQYVFGVVGCILAALFVFIWWRYTSVLRGARQRDERLAKRIDKLAGSIERNEAVDPGKVERLASKPELRAMLYHMLKYYKRQSLFPAKFTSALSQGEATLAFWLTHPNEFGEPPSSVEHVSTIERRLGGGAVGEFFVFRFRFEDGHFAAKDGWLLGLAGPFRKGDQPFENEATAFSRFGDKFGEVPPSELVDWFLAMAKKKGTDFSRS